MPDQERNVSAKQRTVNASQSGWIRSLPKATWMVITGIGVLVGAVLGIIQLVGWLQDVSEVPIRAEFHYMDRYSEGVIVGKFDPHAHFLNVGRTADSHPSVFAQVTSRAEDETVTLSPYLVVQVTDVRPIPERANYLVYPMGGAGGEVDYFVATLAPEREGVFYAPQQTKDTALGPLVRGLTTEKPKTYDYFTLTPGEGEAFDLTFTMLPGYYYWVRVGVQYSYKGRQDVVWSERETVVGKPLEAEVWAAPNSGIVNPIKNKNRVQKFGDLQQYKNYHEQRFGRDRRHLPGYDKPAVQEAIMRQNEAVQEYSYRFTPPEQLNEPEQE
jgi:hypothetical protein